VAAKAPSGFRVADLYAANASPNLSEKSPAGSVRQGRGSRFAAHPLRVASQQAGDLWSAATPRFARARKFRNPAATPLRHRQPAQKQEALTWSPRRKAKTRMCMCVRPPHCRRESACPLRAQARFHAGFHQATLAAKGCAA